MVKNSALSHRLPTLLGSSNTLWYSIIWALHSDAQGPGQRALITNGDSLGHVVRATAKAARLASRGVRQWRIACNRRSFLGQKSELIELRGASRAYSELICFFVHSLPQFIKRTEKKNGDTNLSMLLYSVLLGLLHWGVFSALVHSATRSPLDRHTRMGGLLVVGRWRV